MILNIDGRDLPASKGDTILTVARRHNIDIPTLCYHEAVESWGGCRLCMVEIARKGWDPGWTKLVAACLYPAESDLQVQTRSPRVMESRRVVLDLLLARAPEAPRVRELAREYGLERSSFPTLVQPDKCILCGLCIRICGAIGANALSMVGRSRTKAVSVPFRDDPAECIGCLSCARNCPTEAISWEETSTTRSIWGRTFRRVLCRSCGASLVTVDQADHFARTRGVPRAYFDLCDVCSRKAAAREFEQVVSKNRAMEVE